jgi:hypothetical protein
VRPVLEGDAEQQSAAGQVLGASGARGQAVSANRMPSLSRGTRQKMRRFPRGAIEELAAIGGGGAQVELTEYTARWLAANAARPAE